jgi:hypothetical protein
MEWQGKMLDDWKSMEASGHVLLRYCPEMFLERMGNMTNTPGLGCHRELNRFGIC